MKPENKFRKWFLERLQKHMAHCHPNTKITVQKHADYATDGIADIDLSINGMTCWLEIKLLTSLKEERKLHVTPLQRAYLEGRAKGDVPTGLLVGLALGPRKGYLAALFVPPISEVVHRDMFRQSEHVMEQIYSMAYTAARASAKAFESDLTGVRRTNDFADGDVTNLRDSEYGGDEADADGG